GVRPVAAATAAVGVGAITSAAMSAPTRPSSSASSTTWMRMPATRSARTHERRPEPVAVAPIDHLAQLDHPSGPVLGLLLAPEQWLAGLEPEQLGAAFVGSDRLHREARSRWAHPVAPLEHLVQRRLLQIDVVESRGERQRDPRTVDQDRDAVHRPEPLQLEE